MKSIITLYLKGYWGLNALFQGLFQPLTLLIHRGFQPGLAGHLGIPDD